MLPTNIGTDRHVIREWGSMREYVQTAKDAPMYHTKASPGTLSFEGDESWQATMTVADNGYNAVRPEVDALTESISAHIAPSLQAAFTSYFDVSGGTVDIGRFMDGEPECMVETRLIEIAKPGKVVTILIHGGMLGKVKPEQFVKRGTAIVALVDSLERMQHSTEIWLEVSSGRSSDVTPETGIVLTHLVKLKDAGESLDIDGLMFSVAYPGRHRRISFAIREMEPVGFARKVGVSRDSGEQGATCELTCRDRVGADIVLESLSTFSKVTDSAEEWIKDQLADIGLLREEG